MTKILMGILGLVMLAKAYEIGLEHGREDMKQVHSETFSYVWNEYHKCQAFLEHIMDQLVIEEEDAM